MNPELFAKFVSVTFQKQITYRFEYFMGIVNGFIYVFIFTSLWKALYAQTDGSSMSGFSLTGIITYAVLAMAVRISFSMDDSVIYKKVQDGSISIDLIRPVSFFYMNLAENVGYSLFHLVARALPILAISFFIFDVYIPVGFLNFSLFVISALMGYLILFMFNFTIGLLAFWFIEVFPFMLFKYAFLTLFSGGIVPIDFFPEILKPLIAMMPFQYTLYAPTVILMGHVGTQQALSLIAMQAVWVIVLSVACRAMWRVGRNKLVIQGG